MFGYATDETPELMPLTHVLATQLGYKLTEVGAEGGWTVGCAAGAMRRPPACCAPHAGCPAPVLPCVDRPLMPADPPLTSCSAGAQERHLRVAAPRRQDPGELAALELKAHIAAVCPCLVWEHGKRCVHAPLPAVVRGCTPGAARRAARPPGSEKSAPPHPLGAAPLQVTVEYKKEGGAVVPLRVHTILISTQHSPDVSNETIHKELMEHVIKPVVPEKYLDEKTIFHLNPSGGFCGGSGFGFKEGFEAGSPDVRCVFLGGGGGG